MLLSLLEELVNHDIENIIMPVKAEKLKEKLVESNYAEEEIKYLIEGFTSGFDLEYDGPTQRQNTAHNLPFTVGDCSILWDKVMKEVKLKRYAGPFHQVPFENFIQSPIGLVPKDGGNDTRLIFHLSYDFDENMKSVNHYTAKEKCSVKYKDLDYAVRASLELLKVIGDEVIKGQGHPILWYGKSDIKSAFRLVPLKRGNFWILVMMAYHPETKRQFYFVDKCLPFGHSISCAIFQRFSDALAHLARFKISVKMGIPVAPITNYLDDFLFAALLKLACDSALKVFLQLCEDLGVPISMEKTEWGTNIIVFLGILLNGRYHLLAVPEVKRLKALNLLKLLADKKKGVVKELQSLAGLLNFLHRAIVPGRAFTRRMYAKFSGCISLPDNRKVNDSRSNRQLKPYHHVRLDAEFRQDCLMWIDFLENQKKGICRPFIDASVSVTAKQLDFYSDVTKGVNLGLGAVFGKRWLFARWEDNYIQNLDPSIEYLELLGLCMGVFAWSHLLKNQRVIIFCDNQAVINIMNNTSSACKNCMVLIQFLTLRCLRENIRIFCRWIRGKNNLRADLLSRQKIQ